MKLHHWKRLACKVACTFCVLLIACLFSAVVEGTLPLAVGLVLGLLDLVVLNSLCGALLPQPESPEKAVPAAKAAPAFRIAMGGKAA